MTWQFAKIVSGGQTGVDRAALDVAMQFGLPCGGWCPPGRLAEDGRVPDHYPVQELPQAAMEKCSASPTCPAPQETPWDGYPQRTEWNVRDSDGTLVLTHGEPDRGTALTIELAAKRDKPLHAVDLAGRADAAEVRAWAEASGVRVLNVAGPRESSRPGIHARAAAFLRRLLS